LRLGERVFLEVIADRSAGVKPARPAGSISTRALQAELTERPRLIHWVARTADVERAAARLPDRARSSAIDGAWRVSVADHDPR